MDTFLHDWASCLGRMIMARQGKLAHSPFHVESVRYRYAIEHGEDAESYEGPRDCRFYDRVKAKQLAISCNQIKATPYTELFSEDLW